MIRPLNNGNLMKLILMILPPELLKKFMVAAVPGAGLKETVPVPLGVSITPPVFHVVPFHMATVESCDATEGPSREEHEAAIKYRPGVAGFVSTTPEAPGIVPVPFANCGTTVCVV